MPDRLTPAQCATWLRQLAADVRVAGDLELTTPKTVTLSEELWQIATQLDEEQP